MLPTITRNPLSALLTGTGTLAAVSALAITGMIVTGLPAAAPDAHEPATNIKEAAHASWRESPAAAALHAVLSSPPQGWSAEGEVQQSVTAPSPYSCPLPGVAASTALARSFTAGGHRIRVTTLAYTAGLGAEALRLQLANTGICASDATVQSWSLDGPANDARRTDVVRGGISTSIALSRRGDVITYLTGAYGAPLEDLAGVLDAVMSDRLSGVCLTQDSRAEDAPRSPFAPSGYRPFTEQVEVTIPVPARPTAAPTAKPAPVPATVLVTETAEPLPDPEYPVYPPMPKPVPLPSAPEAPAEAVTATSVAVPAEDGAGPGCGWAFTGMTPPLFDADAARATGAAAMSAAHKKLLAGGRDWQARTARYWAEYTAYEKAAAEYNAYRAKVQAVNGAWEVIAVSWDSYRVKDAEYRRAVEERDRFNARKTDAAAEFRTATAACRPAAPSPSPSAARPAPSPSPTATLPTSPPATPTPSATASPSPAVTPGCPVERPAILDEAAPEVPAKPVPPADPRPKR